MELHTIFESVQNVSCFSAVFFRRAVEIEPIKNVVVLTYIKHARAGLSLRATGGGFSPATKRVAPGYFYWKIEGK